MAFQWQQFCDSYHIHYATSGPNVSRGHIAVHCPFCGPADTSQHMSLNLKHGGWNCWRNDNHSGKKAAYLVQALLGCPRERAQAIVGEAVYIPDDFLGTVQRLVSGDPSGPLKPIKLPPEFKPFAAQASSRRFVNYLTGASRQFTLAQTAKFTKRYGLHYCTQGKFKDRVIFPVTFEGKLMTFTGRTIHRDVELRYKTLSADPELEDTPAAGPVSDFLLFYDQLMANKMDADTLILCEGPFDALKINVLGRRHGIAATCCFTSSPSQSQIDMFGDLIPIFHRRYILFDRGTLHTALRTGNAMSTAIHRALTLPKHLKDPGEMSENDLLEIIN